MRIEEVINTLEEVETFVNELQRTSVGKVDFRRLEDEAEKGAR